MIVPTKCTFDNPSERDDFKSNGTVTSLRHLNGPFALLQKPCNEFLFIPTIYSELLHARIFSLQLGTKEYGTIRFLYRCSCHDNEKEHAQCVNNNMSFPSIHVFSPIIARLSTNFGGFDALAINNRQTWTVLLARLSSYANNKGIIDTLPGAIICPFLQVPIDGGRMRLCMWDHLPLTARFVLVKEGIDHTTQADAAWSSKMFSHINIWSNKLPFSVMHITRIVGCMHTLHFHIFSLVNLSL